MPPGRSPTVTTNLTNHPSTARPRPITQPLNLPLSHAWLPSQITSWWVQWCHPAGHWLSQQKDDQLPVNSQNRSITRPLNQPPYLAPISDNILVSSAMPPRWSLTVTTNLTSRPSTAKPRSITRSLNQPPSLTWLPSQIISSWSWWVQRCHWLSQQIWPIVRQQLPSQITSTAKPRSITWALNQCLQSYLAPISDNILVSSVIPPGRPLTVTTNLTSCPSTAKPCSITRAPQPNP